MELRDTILDMLSDDYKKRFTAEVNQLEIRKYKLSRLIRDYEEDKLDFEPVCPINMLKQQLELMELLINLLYERAEIEGIDIS